VIFGLSIASFIALFGAPAVMIALMLYYSWRISRGDD